MSAGPLLDDANQLGEPVEAPGGDDGGQHRPGRRPHHPVGVRDRDAAPLELAQIGGEPGHEHDATTTEHQGAVDALAVAGVERDGAGEAIVGHGARP